MNKMKRYTNVLGKGKHVKQTLNTPPCNLSSPHYWQRLEPHDKTCHDCITIKVLNAMIDIVEILVKISNKRLNSQYFKQHAAVQLPYYERHLCSYNEAFWSL